MLKINLGIMQSLGSRPAVSIKNAVRFDAIVCASFKVATGEDEDWGKAQEKGDRCSSEIQCLAMRVCNAGFERLCFDWKL